MSDFDLEELHGDEAALAAAVLNRGYAETGKPRRLVFVPPWHVRGPALIGPEGKWFLECTACGETAIGERHEGGGCS